MHRDAFARWRQRRSRDTDARLVLLGSEKIDDYQRLATLHDVDRHVVFVPPAEDVAPWYAAADVCVLLSWYDPCSRVVLEATRLGIPSITTAWNGAGEVLTGDAGIVVASPKRIADVAGAMDELTDPDRRRRAGDACRAISDQLSIGRHVDELMAVYKEVTGC